MAIEWTQNLSVGVNSIDDQHKTLFEKANQLFEAGKNNKTKEFIAELLDFLDAKLKKEYQESVENIIVLLNANQMVVDWLLKHISTEDKKIGAYANSL